MKKDDFYKMVIIPGMVRGDGGDNGDGGDGGDGGAGAGDNGDGGAGDDSAKLKAQLADMQKSLKKLESKRDELLNENRTFKDKYSAFDGLDPEAVKAMYQSFENDEEKKLLAEGKFDSVLDKRMEKIKADYSGKLKSLESEKATYYEKLSAAETQIRDMTIDTNITENFVKAQGRKEAIEDVKLRAKGVWKYEMDDKGKGELVPRGSNGEILEGKNGVLTPSEWVESLRETAPHLFPESQGSGANGNKGTGGNSIQGKIDAARRAGDVAELRRLKAQQRKAAEGG